MGIIGWLIIGAEIAFWVVILLGLVTRCLLKKKGLGLFFLALTPIIDLILLIATTFDLYNGATATTVHAIAAIYLGVSIAFGKSMISWADRHFTYYVLKTGSKPEKKYGYAYARQQMKGSLQHVLAFVIGAAFIFSIHYFIGDPERTSNLLDPLRVWALVVAVDIALSASYFIWLRRAKA